jgi:hypothetical protein
VFVFGTPVYGYDEQGKLGISRRQETEDRRQETEDRRQEVVNLHY